MISGYNLVTAEQAEELRQQGKRVYLPEELRKDELYQKMTGVVFVEMIKNKQPYFTIQYIEENTIKAALAHKRSTRVKRVPKKFKWKNMPAEIMPHFKSLITQNAGKEVVKLVNQYKLLDHEVCCAGVVMPDLKMMVKNNEI